MGLVIRVEVSEELVAFHEAGHVVVGLEVGAPVAFAYLSDSDEPGGWVSDDFQPWADGASKVERAAYHLGGYAGERVLLGHEAFVHPSDYNDAVRFLTGKNPKVDAVPEGAFRGDCSAELAESYALACRLVDANKAAVPLIARELQETRRVEGPRLREIVDSCRLRG